MAFRAFALPLLGTLVAGYAATLLAARRKTKRTKSPQAVAKLDEPAAHGGPVASAASPSSAAKPAHAELGVHWLNKAHAALSPFDHPDLQSIWPAVERDSAPPTRRSPAVEPGPSSPEPDNPDPTPDFEDPSTPDYEDPSAPDYEDPAVPPPRA